MKSGRVLPLDTPRPGGVVVVVARLGCMDGLRRIEASVERVRGGWEEGCRDEEEDGGVGEYRR